MYAISVCNVKFVKVFILYDLILRRTRSEVALFVQNVFSLLDEEITVMFGFFL